MDWASAKKMVVLFLIIINFGLFVINYTQKKHYNISPVQEKNISQILNKNGIVLNSDINMNYKPMGRLESQLYTYEKKDIEEIFFDGNITILTEKQNDTTKEIQYIYENQTHILSIYGEKGIFEEKGAEWTTIKTQESEAIQLAEDEMKKLEPLFGSLVNTQSYYTNEGWVVEFSERKEDYLIYSNNFKAYISDFGLYKIEFNYVQVVQYVEEAREIISPDEALLSFIRYWVGREDVAEVVDINKDLERNGIVTTHNIEIVELGYYIQEQRNLIAGTRFYMEPCYIVYLQDYKEPYFINSYTGDVVAIES